MDNEKKQLLPIIIPSLMISYGALAHNIRIIRKVDRETSYEVDKYISRAIRLDDYLQYAPTVAVFGLKISGVKSKHSLKDITIVSATSNLLMAISVNSMKHTTGILRPDNSTRNSFPSGHTATAFVGAHMLFREYYETSFWLSVSGYLASTTTGVLRVMNKRHWVSDVVAGAGIGILSVEFGYLLLPTVNKLLFPNSYKNSKSISFTPTVSSGNIGMGMVCVF